MPAVGTRDNRAPVLADPGVAPNYKPDWDLPGGMAEANEARIEAVRRELREALGVTITVQALCVDQFLPHGPRDDTLVFRPCELLTQLPGSVTQRTSSRTRGRGAQSEAGAGGTSDALRRWLRQRQRRFRALVGRVLRQAVPPMIGCSHGYSRRDR
jgi:ADP-ribose pyrophosphatase YjhB (NUDIX family)